MLQNYLGKDLVIYFVFGILIKAFPMIVGVALAYLLSPIEYGRSALFISMASIFSGIISFGLPSLIVKERVVLERKPFNELLSSSLALMLGLSILAYITLRITVNHLHIEVVEQYALVIVFSGFCLGSHSLFLKIYISDEKSFIHGCLDFIKSFLISGLGLIFVYASKERTADDQIFGISIGYLLLFIIVVSLFFSFISPPRITIIVRCFKYGLKVIPQIISNLIKMGADKFFISILFVEEELGVYSFVFLVCSSFLVLGNAVNNFYSPKSFSFFEDKNIKGLDELRIKLSLFLIGSFGASTILLYFYFSDFSPEYYKTDFSNIVFISFSFLFQSLYFLYAKSFLYYEKMFELGIGNLVCVGIYITIMYFASYLGPYFPMFVYGLTLFVFVFVFGIRLEKAENVNNRR